MKITKKQHYVSKFYLKAWIVDKKENLFCLRDNKIFLSNIINLAQERYFYEIKEINDKEIDFLKRIIFQNKNSELVKSMLSVIRTSNRIFKLIEIANYLEKYDSEKIEDLFKKELKEHHENYFGEIENKASPLFEKLIKGDKGFLNDYENKKFFLLHTVGQYLRTKSMKENLKKEIENLKKEIENIKKKVENICIENIFTVIVIYFSIQLASNINENNYNIVFIKNLTDKYFITSDQPVINIWKAKNPEKKKIEDIELYMPITPKLGILISKNIYHDLEISKVEELEEYNNYIVSSSLEQIFSNNKEQLEYYKS
ncbi:DUF4238 domain-containing protein [Aliarcobacter cryaerophilus]|uniref:DUF4238 domain-containing protein n=1 Tax=Aliarcobacter cryaerophilus TaxID=28198 RepID=UPI0021B18AD8|nr:DUF4238 domain-containing protein [Aliarcobacter cryaerophilus]MCT7443512.1 DUF4238 domain-containing protein [Aliarcobacter cryaerophilus]MCT7479000.1 DUF4238 domain-containing protein [Aliarcobacter cryaerophilus]MCT7483374.1 DUF4238 domain-containing protein [Aliarcobacter cryaerophilus]MCT7532674.1 DUF4238 domain-containing protein [Aliarcobacter cryaerophilus]MCT7542293.1 DUF4238 domain-containing protein [Aliarcobacter cryaerophilus]